MATGVWARIAPQRMNAISGGEHDLRFFIRVVGSGEGSAAESEGVVNVWRAGMNPKIERTTDRRPLRRLSWAHGSVTGD